MNRELYSILSMKTEADPLQITNGERENYSYRGAAAWHKITREVAGKTGTRLERLADKVHHPKQIESYADAMAQLNKWKLNCAELAKIEGQQISDITKRTTLKRMLPTDLAHDLEKSKELKDWNKAWNFVIEQVPLRKEWRPNRKKDPDAMDQDAAESDEESDEKSDPVPTCQTCTETDGSLNSLKGKSKGQFQGYCSFCWLWGHKRADCKKRLALEAGKGSQSSPKGAEKGKDVGGQVANQNPKGA